MSYNRTLSPGSRRINNPARASDSSFDPYTSQRHPSHASPRTSSDRVVPISTTTYVNLPSSTGIPSARPATVYDSYSGRPRRSSLIEPPSRTSNSTAQLPPRVRPTVVQGGDVVRPASPRTREREYYVTPASSKESREPRKFEHKKVYSVDDGGAKLVADLDVPTGTKQGERHHRRKESGGGDRNAVYRSHGEHKERRTYPANSTAVVPRSSRTVDDEDAFSYTDPASMYRDTEPRWREVARPRRGSVDRGGATSRERPVSMIDPFGADPRKSNREIGPPPSQRGWDKLNDGLGRSRSVRDGPRDVPHSPIRGREDTRAAYADSRDPYYVAPRKPSVERSRPLALHQDRPQERYDNYEYEERREPRHHERRLSATQTGDPSVSRRGFGIRSESQDRYGGARGSDESFERRKEVVPVVRDSGYAEPHRRETIADIEYSDPRKYVDPHDRQVVQDRLLAERIQAEERDRIPDKRKDDRLLAERMPVDERERIPDRRKDDRLPAERMPIDEREKIPERRKDQDRVYDDYERDSDRARRDRDRDSDRHHHSHRRDADREGDGLGTAAKVAAGGLAGAAALYGLNKEKEKREDVRDDRPRDRERDRPREVERERERERPKEKERERVDRERDRDRDSDRDRRERAERDVEKRRQRTDRSSDEPPFERESAPRHADADRGLGFAFEMPNEPPKPREREREREREIVNERDYERSHEDVPPPTQQAPPPAIDADEDYRRRMEQVQRELGLPTDDRHSPDFDPERERRRREREQRMLERQQDRMASGGDSSSVGFSEGPPPSHQRSFDNDDGPELRKRASIIDQRMPDIPTAQIIDNSQSDKRETRVRIVDPPTEEEERKPRGILKRPTEKFPEDPNVIREGVAPLKDATKKGIPPGARWTKIDRRLVNPEALEEAKERYEERLDCVIVLRVLTKEEIQKLADRTRELRDRRFEDEERAERKANRRRERNKERRDRDEYEDEDSEDEYAERAPRLLEAPSSAGGPTGASDADFVRENRERRSERERERESVYMSGGRGARE